MDASKPDADAIRTNGWRQGSLLLPANLPREVVASLDLADGALLYVLTHDCDLVQPDFEKEPSVEFLVVVPISKADGNYLHGRHPRIIDVLTKGGAFRASCHSRTVLKREILCSIRPAGGPAFDDYTRDVISQWISKRYIRPAFPDAFNFRLRHQGKAIQKFLKEHGHRFRQILVACNPARTELPPDDSYDLILWLVEVFDLDTSAAAVSSAALAHQLGGILRQCPGILLDDCRVVTEDDVTLGHTRIMAEWDFDYLTHREALQPS